MTDGKTKYGTFQRHKRIFCPMFKGKTRSVNIVVIQRQFDCLIVLVRGHHHNHIHDNNIKLIKWEKNKTNANVCEGGY